MKNAKKAMIPMLAVLFGVSAAFATHQSKTGATLVQEGYFYDDSIIPQCVKAVDSECTTVLGDICTWMDDQGNSHNLREFVNGTQCGDVLYKQ